MTVSAWIRDQNVSLLVSPPTSAGVTTLSWSTNPELPALPWGDRLPVLLILGIGLSLTTAGGGSARRVKISVVGPAFDGTNLSTVTWNGSGTQNAGQTRRHEFAAGLSFDTTLVPGQMFRDALPSGLYLLPGSASPGSGTLTVSIENWVAGSDSYPNITVTGRLFPL